MLVLWLVGLIGAGILVIDFRFLINPAAGATGFGVPVPAAEAYAYLQAKGIRDIVSVLIYFIP